jgi:hypothetical protein
MTLILEVASGVLIGGAALMWGKNQMAKAAERARAEAERIAKYRAEEEARWIAELKDERDYILTSVMEKAERVERERMDRLEHAAAAEQATAEGRDFWTYEEAQEADKREWVFREMARDPYINADHAAMKVAKRGTAAFDLAKAEALKKFQAEDEQRRQAERERREQAQQARLAKMARPHEGTKLNREYEDIVAHFAKENRPISWPTADEYRRFVAANYPRA